MKFELLFPWFNQINNIRVKVIRNGSRVSIPHLSYSMIHALIGSVTSASQKQICCLYSLKACSIYPWDIAMPCPKSSCAESCQLARGYHTNSTSPRPCRTTLAQGFRPCAILFASAVPTHSEHTLKCNINPNSALPHFQRTS